MNLQNLVLSKDLRLATNLYECCYSCLNRARMEFYRDNLDEAERWVKEFERCKRDLDELIKRKKEHDQLVQLVETLKARGIDIEIIVRKGNE
jgi:hypothetical protein